MDKIEKIKYEAKIDRKSFEVLNSEFTRAKCYVMYTGDNRNYSSMSKESVEEAIPTLFNTPVIGEFIETAEDFGTHGGKIEISDKGIKYVQTTKPFGCVPESANPRWEMVKHEDGTEKEYLVVDVVLWSGRYSELDTLISEAKPQSMEINVLEGDFNDKNIFEIKKFEFSALCILGSDVEPCFEKSAIQTYSIDTFKQELDEMMKEYKKFSIEQKEEIEKDKETFAETEVVVEDEKETETEDMVCGDKKEKMELETEGKQEVLFSATYKQKREALSNCLDSVIVRDEDGMCISETSYWVEDFDDEYVMVERCIWTQSDYTCDYGRFKYSFDQTTLIATITSSFEKMIKVWLTEEENQRLQQERETMTAEFEALKTKVSELQTYKDTNEFEIKKAQIAEVIEEFESELVGCEEFATIKLKAIDFEVDELEEKLSAMAWKFKNKSKSKVKTKSNFSRVNVVEVIEKEEDKPIYGEAEKYFKKS